MNEKIDQGDSRRDDPRYGVLKGVKILFGAAVIDGLVLDISPSGARIRTNAAATICEHVTLQFSGGSVFMAQRRWVRGDELGFQFHHAAPLADDHARSVALSAYNNLLENYSEIPIQLLRAARFFDDPVLAKVTEEAEAAHARFRTVLEARTKTSIGYALVANSVDMVPTRRRP